MKALKYARSFEILPDLPAELEPLRTLAYNLRWSWHSPTQRLFAETAPDLWESSGHNPVQVLNGLTSTRAAELAADAVYMKRLTDCTADLNTYLSSRTWFDQAYQHDAKSTCIAYFCAEFGITECLPIYSGGLGILAGDHLKSSSDLGIPLVGVGLLYARGYFRQTLTADGWQQEHYPEYDFYKLPLTLIRGDDGQPKMIEVEFPDRSVHCQIWKAQVGRVPLYLLDSNVLENEPKDQDITDTLYGGDEEMRIRQECVLGIGGFRALQALGITPTVCHMNEGHAAFSALERISSLMKQGMDYRTARQCVSAGNVFTTHTPVPAGFDLFNRTLLERYLGRTTGELGIPFDQFLRQGRIHPNSSEENFNMAVLAMENSSRVNGVSKLHAEVSRGMFHPRWPKFPVPEVPIGAVTNGIHTLSWISPRVEAMLDRITDSAWRSDVAAKQVWEWLCRAEDHDLWEMREDERMDFVQFCRRHASRATSRTEPWRRGVDENLLDPRALTIGFARRFATYKRASLLFSDRERLKALLSRQDQPVQFVFAGKSHPRDDGGKKLIQEIVQFIRQEDIGHRMVFLEDYDIAVAREMVRGVDVWLNNPRRPMEASGTSGMKVLPNGGLNLSILDGWWAEGYDPEAGWAIGDGSMHPDEHHQDWLDSQALYGLLENEVIPKFYQRDENGMPTEWLAMMRASMCRLTPEFSTNRMVRDYTRLYAEASSAFRHLSAENGQLASRALEWRDRVVNAWPGVKILNVEDNGDALHKPGGNLDVSVSVQLNGLLPRDVRVQILLGEVGPNRELQNAQTYNLEPNEEATVFSLSVECVLPGHRGFIARIVPYHPDVLVSSELPLVEWQESMV